MTSKTESNQSHDLSSVSDGLTLSHVDDRKEVEMIILKDDMQQINK